MSRFVSAGAIQDGEAPPQDEWAAAQQELDVKRQLEQSQPKTQEGGKSLYEVLQANRAAKQEKFEEAARLKNQFRSLDDDEVEFLDSVLESTRAKDDAIRQETQNQLKEFRQRQDKTGDVAEDHEQDPDQLWSLKRKRKKNSQAGNLKGLKVRRSSSSAAEPSVPLKSKKETQVPSESFGKGRPEPKEDETPNTVLASTSSAGPTTKTLGLPSEESKSASTLARPASLALAGYSSDDSD